MCENLDFEVFTDEKWLEFILGQLIQNSIKYAREDGAKIVFSGALLDEGLASERIELTVADNGCGVSAADLPRVFEKGFTGDNGRTTKRATGIGLYLVARLCSKMGIDVTAASEPGEGFVVTLAFSTNKFNISSNARGRRHPNKNVQPKQNVPPQTGRHAIFYQPTR